MSGLPTFRVVNGRKVLVMWPNGEDEYRDALDRVELADLAQASGAADPKAVAEAILAEITPPLAA